MAYQFKTIIPATEDDRSIIIVKAVEIICARHIAGETATAIVIPPRVGKSDTQRCASTELVQNGYASFALSLTPWDNLTNQLTSQNNTKQFSARYLSKKAPNPPSPAFNSGRLPKLSTTFHETSRLTHLFTCTIQLAQQAPKDLFKTLILRAMEYGQRPIFFIDEAHLLSEKNKWGELAKVFQDGGAHVVLLTGTPYRADKESIPGFKISEISREDDIFVKSTRIDDEYVRKETFDTTRICQRLSPDYEVSLKQAWDIKALTKLEPMWIGASLVLEGGNGESKKLTDLSAADQAKNRRKASTHPAFIRECCSVGLQQLDVWRKTHKDAAMLIVTASDIDNGEYDGLANAHARQFKHELIKQNQSIDIKIATQASDSKNSKSDKAKSILRRFSSGDGDILIVKNMGTVGLDCPRIKILIFAGTYRQWPSWLQTILRPATAWNNVSHCNIILLDDKSNRENYKNLIIDEGGEYKQTLSTLLSTEIAEKPKEEIEKDKYNVLDAKLSQVQDSHMDGWISKELFEKTQRVMNKKPTLRTKVSALYLAELINDGLMNVPDYDDDNDIVEVQDSGKEVEFLAPELEGLAREYATKMAPYHADRDEWIKHKTDISRRAAVIAGFKAAPSLESDPERILVAISYINGELSKVSS